MTEIESVIAWVQSGKATKRKTFNTKVTSYGLKHIAEKSMGIYIGMDSFIEAMDMLGFNKKQEYPESINYFFNIHVAKEKND
jgi:surface polysaccharide O-acyltransferase-like enzyme